MKDGMPLGFGVGISKVSGFVIIGYFRNSFILGKYKKFKYDGFSIEEKDEEDSY